MVPPLAAGVGLHGARLHVALPVDREQIRLCGDDLGGVVNVARAVEDAGLNGVVVTDHVVMGERTDRYPWGRFPATFDGPWPEPLTLLTAVAASTEHVRLATGILIAPLRPAVLLAKTIATLDRISNGRVDLGVGAGWQQEEFEAEGLDHARRGQLLTDYMQACRVLWGPGPASFTSPSVSFANVWCEPKPVRPNGPPVLFSGTLTQRNIDRIVGIGDGWIPIMGETVEGISEGVRQLRDLLHAAGHDPGDLLVRTRLPVAVRDSNPNIEATLDAAAVYVDAGVTDLVIGLSPFVSEPAAIGPWLAQVGRRWRAVRG